MISIQDAGNTFDLPLQPSADQVIAVAIDILAKRHRRGEQLSDPKTVTDYLRLRIGASTREVFHVSFLDSQLRVIHDEIMFQGSVSDCVIPAQEIARAALRHSAVSVVLGHNHPGGRCEPSQADIAITRKIREILTLVDVRIVDHVIVSPTSFYSFAKAGIL